MPTIFGKTLINIVGHFLIIKIVYEQVLHSKSMPKFRPKRNIGEINDMLFRQKIFKLCTAQVVTSFVKSSFSSAFKNKFCRLFSSLRVFAPIWQVTRLFISLCRILTNASDFATNGQQNKKTSLNLCHTAKQEKSPNYRFYLKTFLSKLRS